MEEDKERWNEKYRTLPMPGKVSDMVRNYASRAGKGYALDLACGQGRHAVWLAEQGFERVDAVDISEAALSRMAEHPALRKIEADLDHYTIAEGDYDLIVNFNYLDRRMFPQIRSGLKPGGLLIFETFVEAEGPGFHQPSNPAYLLQSNELLHAFIGLEILYYAEHEEANLRGERVNVASLVARRRVP